MDIKELLGDSYKEGMTVDDINTALSSKNLADLSTGKYVNKEMADAKSKKADEEIRNLKSQLSSRMTDDEKRAKEIEDRDAVIEQLKEQIRNSVIQSNKSKLYASTSEMTSKMGINADDKEFNSFLGFITLEDEKNNEAVGSYLGKLLQKAYQQGIDDTTKSNIANNNSIQTGSQTNSQKEKNMGSILAESKRKEHETYSNQKSNFFN